MVFVIKFPIITSRKQKPIGNDKPDYVVSIEKGDDQSRFLVILNFSKYKLEVKIDISDSDHNMNSFLELFSRKKIEISEFRDFSIEAYGFYLLKPV